MAEYYRGCSNSQRLANTSNQWLSPDDTKTFSLNMKKNKELLLSQGWDKRKVDYSFNEHGFRADSFNNGPGMMFFGCSLTFGLGLELEHMWSKLLAEHFQLAHWNLADAGASNDTAFRLGSYWIPKLLPKVVVMFATFAERIELIDPNNQSTPIKHIGVHSVEKRMKPEDTYVKYLDHPTNGHLNLDKNVKAIKMICSQNNVPIVVLSADDYSDLIFQKYKGHDDFARDLMHPGIEKNKQLFKDFKGLIKSEIKL